MAHVLCLCCGAGERLLPGASGGNAQYWYAKAMLSRRRTEGRKEEVASYSYSTLSWHILLRCFRRPCWRHPALPPGHFHCNKTLTVRSKRRLPATREFGVVCSVQCSACRSEEWRPLRRRHAPALPPGLPRAWVWGLFCASC